MILYLINIDKFVTGSGQTFILKWSAATTDANQVRLGSFIVSKEKWLLEQGEIVAHI